MQHLSPFYRLAVLAGALFFSLASIAQTSADMAQGEIRKVDKEAGKVTIRHGEIKSIDMPPMTMVFVMRDPAALDSVKAGDKVLFNVVREDGKYIVTQLQPAAQ